MHGLYQDYTISNQRPHRLSSAEIAELEQKVTELLANGRIKPSDSPWGAPVTFSWKKDGTRRMCIDYRALNRYVIPLNHPTPLMSDFFDALAGATVSSALDAENAYWHVPIHEDDQYLTAFNTHMGSLLGLCVHLD